jgi:hypothetical protein
VPACCDAAGQCLQGSALRTLLANKGDDGFLRLQHWPFSAFPMPLCGILRRPADVAQMNTLILYYWRLLILGTALAVLLLQS